MSRRLYPLNEQQCIKCTYHNCSSVFSRPWDLQRHIQTVHLKTKAFYCPIDGCKRSLSPTAELKGFLRRDKRKEHFVKIHKGVEIDLEGFDSYVSSLDAVAATDHASLVGTSFGQNDNGFSTMDGDMPYVQMMIGLGEPVLDNVMQAGNFSGGQFMEPHQYGYANSAGDGYSHYGQQNTSPNHAYNGNPSANNITQDLDPAAFIGMTNHPGLTGLNNAIENAFINNGPSDNFPPFHQAANHQTEFMSFNDGHASNEWGFQPSDAQGFGQDGVANGSQFNNGRFFGNGM